MKKLLSYSAIVLAGAITFGALPWIVQKNWGYYQQTEVLPVVAVYPTGVDGKGDVKAAALLKRPDGTYVSEKTDAVTMYRFSQREQGLTMVIRTRMSRAAEDVTMLVLTAMAASWFLAYLFKP